MTKIEHIKCNENYNMMDDLKKDVIDGFSKPIKSLPSKYFYDDFGSELFNQITAHPDYYLTGCELEILNTAKFKLAKRLGKERFNLVELGPGEGIKTEVLIDHFLQEQMNFTYIPIDISAQYLNKIVTKLDKHQPAIHLLPIHADYFDGLEWLNLESTISNIVLFLGSSIGNFSISEAKDFLCHLKENVHENDYVLIGFDLRKDIDLLMSAYNDSDGITRNFNLNLLHRLNNTLGANFDVNKFKHYATYNVSNAAMESYLVAREAQWVSIPAIQRSYHFDPMDAIHNECSYKYSLAQIEEFAQLAGFKIIEHFFDSKHYFVDSLWQAI